MKMHVAGWAGAVALAISSLGWLMIYQHYAGLPQTIVLRFDPLGRALGARPRAALLVLPIVGLVVQPVHI